jgi:hypothetical protein
MIIRRLADHLLLITQPDHAALAAAIVERWHADDLPHSPRRESILHAVREHDSGWAGPDTSPLVDHASGELLDFIQAPVLVRQSVWPQSVERLVADPWAAALVAHHAITVYGRYRDDPAWHRFFADMTTRRDLLCAELDLPIDVLEQDYLFLRLGDLGSLAFCNAWADAQRFGPYELRFDAGADHLTIRPDPFSGNHFDVSVRARRLAERTYSSVGNAERAYAAAPVVTLRTRVRGG